MGKGANGIVQTLLSPMFPGTVLKSGNKKRLQQEAHMMARMRYPGVVHVYAIMREDCKPDPNKHGYLIMERMAHDLVSFQDGRSASKLPVSLYLQSIEYNA